ncbi:type 1 fimbrial protein [Erwinia tracheiphila]|uniref:Type 1 fimbrial protein n=1 Tax=Erwinia tracheiphila TaxID=65700 RepID=A0A345CZH3_9GAMM|nr:type 1 fimbrial protein [Erwinia tracheiphila]
MFNYKKIMMIVLAAGFSSAGVTANDGTITFRGTISDTTCDISGGDEANADQGADFTVTLPQVSTSALSKANQFAGDTRFHIALSGENCTNGKVANVIFERAQSNNIDTATGFLKNTVSADAVAGGARNVFIRILNNDKTPLNLALLNASHQPVTIADQKATFQYWAQYATVGGAASAGNVESDVVYSVTYQ